MGADSETRKLGENARRQCRHRNRSFNWFRRFVAIAETVRVGRHSLLAIALPGNPHATRIASVFTPVTGEYAPVNGRFCPVNGDYSPVNGWFSPVEGIGTPLNGKFTPVTFINSPVKRNFTSVNGGNRLVSRIFSSICRTGASRSRRGGTPGPRRQRSSGRTAAKRRILRWTWRKRGRPLAFKHAIRDP